MISTIIYYQIEAGNDDFQTKISRVMIEKAFEIDDMNSRKIIPDSIKKAKLVILGDKALAGITKILPTNIIKAVYNLYYSVGAPYRDYNNEKHTIELKYSGEIYKYNGGKFPLEKVEVFYPSHIQEKLLDSKMNYVKSEGLEMKSGYKLEIEIKLDTTKLYDDEIRDLSIHDIVKKFVVNDSIDINY
jgi:hypothetical protein